MKCNNSPTILPEQATYDCPDCNTPGLEIAYDYPGLKKYIGDGRLLSDDSSMWRRL